MNKKVIVFGATGTLGAHITTHLRKKAIRYMLLDIENQTMAFSETIMSHITRWT